MQRRARGFTLVELLLFVVIFTLVMGSIIAVLVAAVRVQSNQSSAVEVETEGQFLTQKIQYYVQSAPLIAMTADAATGTLTLAEAGGTDLDFIYASSGVMYLRQGAGGTPQALTSAKVKVSSTTFTRHYSIATSSAAYGIDSVSYSFTLAENTTNATMEYVKEFQSSAAVSATVGKIALVEQKKNEINNSGQTGIAATLANPVAAGDLVVAVVSNTGGASANISISDSQNNTWTKVANPTYAAYSQQMAVFAAPNAASGADTVTASFGSSVTNPSLFLYDYRGAATSSPFDVSSTQTIANSTVPASGSASPANAAPELVMGVLYSNPSTEIPTPGSGFTLETTSTVSATYVESMVQYLTGAVSAGWTYKQTAPSSSALMVTFK